MNRKEAMKIIRSNRPIYRDWQEEFDEALERLQQPPTLAEFLGWEEGVEYRRGGNILKVEGNHLLDKRPDGKFYNTICSTAELIDLRNATKYEPRYRAKVKGWELIENNKFMYWIADNEEGDVFIGTSSPDSRFQTRLAIREWNELGINDKNADFEEAEE